MICAREYAGKWVYPKAHRYSLLGKRIDNAAARGTYGRMPASAEKPIHARTSRYSQKDSDKVKPFLKWAGGKGQLLHKLKSAIHLEIKQSRSMPNRL